MTTTPRRILLVDDSPEDRQIIRRLMERTNRLGYQFTEATTGTEGVEACRRESFDCILLDYDLPDRNGLEILLELVPDPLQAQFAVVILTGRGAESIAVLSMKRGAHDYLVKGQFTGEVLRQTIEDAIAQVASQREQDHQQRELERLYGETRAADGRKDDFLAMLGHELRNPLGTVLNAVRILNLRQASNEQDLHLIEIIERQILHLCRLVDDLLDVSRITQGKLQLRIEPTLLNDRVAMAAETLRTVIETRQQALILQVSDDPITIRADPTRIEQIIINILNNASKYTDSGGTITLRTEREGSDALLSVRDNGIGIAPEMLARVFDLFSQAEVALDRSQGGLGIGLTLVRNLVEMHGGQITAASEGTNRGSEFTVRLPIHETAPLVPKDEPEVARDASVRRPVRVLIVDDNVHAAESLTMLIQMWDHQAEMVHNGTEVIRAATRFEPDLILLDIGLPGQDGYSVARDIRAHPQLSGTFLVAMTGHGRDRDLGRSHDAGFDHHLLKPLNFDELELMLADLDATRARLRALPPELR